MSAYEWTVPARQSLIEDGGDDPSGDLLPWSVLNGLSSMVRCDSVSVGILDSRRCTIGPGQDLPEDPVETDPARAAQSHALFFRHYWDSLPCSYPDRTGDIDRVLLASDFYTNRELHRTGMWSEYLRPYGFEHEMIVCLAAGPDAPCAWCFGAARVGTSPTTTAASCGCCDRTCTGSTATGTRPGRPTSRLARPNSLP